MVDPVDLLRAGLANRYRLRAEIGRCGMVTVYRADDLMSGLPVAGSTRSVSLGAARATPTRDRSTP